MTDFSRRHLLAAVGGLTCAAAAPAGAGVPPLWRAARAENPSGLRIVAADDFGWSVVRRYLDLDRVEILAVPHTDGSWCGDPVGNVGTAAMMIVVGADPAFATQPISGLLEQCAGAGQIALAVRVRCAGDDHEIAGVLPFLDAVLDVGDAELAASACDPILFALLPGGAGEIGIGRLTALFRKDGATGSTRPFAGSCRAITIAGHCPDAGDGLEMALEHCYRGTRVERALIRVEGYGIPSLDRIVGAAQCVDVWLGADKSCLSTAAYPSDQAASGFERKLVLSITNLSSEALR